MVCLPSQNAWHGILDFPYDRVCLLLHFACSGQIFARMRVSLGSRQPGVRGTLVCVRLCASVSVSVSVCLYIILVFVTLPCAVVAACVLALTTLLIFVGTES
mgnify:CR=1 FL=1